VFNLLIEDYTRCEECLKECLAIDPNEINGLLLYSVICAMQDKLDIAETFLERVTAQESENVIAWTLYSMLYEQKGQDRNAEISLKQVLKLNQAQYLDQQNSLAASQNQLPIELDDGSSTARKEGEAGEMLNLGFGVFNSGSYL
jgi:tetratricopeptide (TPR) repeat protein